MNLFANLFLIWCLIFLGFRVRNFKFDVSSLEFVLEGREAIVGITLYKRGRFEF